MLNVAVLLQWSLQMNEEINILIIDDEKQNLELAELVLKKEGYKLHFSGDGLSSLKLLNKQKIDLVLLDIMLPDISGFEILKTIRESEKLQHIKVVIVSALNDNKNTPYAKMADGYLTKPYDILSLKSIIKEMLLLSKQMRFKAKDFLDDFFNSFDFDFNEEQKREIAIKFLSMNMKDIEEELEFLQQIFKKKKVKKRLLENKFHFILIELFSKANALELEQIKLFYNFD